MMLSKSDKRGIVTEDKSLHQYGTANNYNINI